MNIRITCLLPAFLVSLLAVPRISAQNGSVTGSVVDAATGDSLSGATVAILGTLLGAIANESGSFNIPGVPQGTYAVSAARFGYLAKTVQAVIVNSGDTAHVAFQLQKLAFAENPSNRFTSPQAATSEAKDAFQKLLDMQAQHNIDFGVSADSLRMAAPGNMVRRMVLEFDSLLSTSPTLAPDTSNRRRYYVPMEVAGRVQTVVELVTESPYWVIAGFGKSRTTRLLNGVRHAVGPVGVDSLSVLEVPNIHARIVMITTQTGPLFVTDYPPFQFDTAVELAQLMPELQKGAQDFDARYGRQLRVYRGRLY